MYGSSPENIFSFKNQINLNYEFNEESDKFGFIILDVILIGISLEMKRPVWCLRLKLCCVK